MGTISESYFLLISFIKIENHIPLEEDKKTPTRTYN